MDESWPGDSGAEGIQLPEGHFVIDLFRIAAGYAVERNLCELGFEGQNGPRLPSGVGWFDSRQLQHFLNEREILCADFDGLLIGFEVVVAVRQSQTTLIEIRYHHSGILSVRAGAKTEEGNSPGTVQITHGVGQAGLVPNRRDAIELRFQGSPALGFNRHFVRA